VARYACIALPYVRIEIAREKEQKARHTVPSSRLSVPPPLAVVVARPGGAVQEETDLLGNTRIDVVSRDARALGVHAGQTISAARAKSAELRVRVVAADAVEGALARVAEASLAFGPTTSFDVATDVAWVDVTGCAGLFGGERGLAEALAERVRAMGHVCRIAIADGPRVASAVARFAPSRKRVIVVDPGADAEAMRVLPLRALPLEDEAIAWLSHVGMRTGGDLQKLPRRALAVRLGERAASVMRLLEGDDGAPLTPYRPPEVPEERVDLEYGIESTEALAFVAKTLCDRIAARLAGRAMSAVRLELVLSLDRDIAKGVMDDVTPALAMKLPSPIARASDLLVVLRAKIERYEFAAPIRAVTLRVPELAHAPARALDLFEPIAKADVALPRLAAELVAELGELRVGTLVLEDSWVPEERTRLVPLGAEPPPLARSAGAGPSTRSAGAGPSTRSAGAGPSTRSARPGNAVVKRFLSSAAEPSRVVPPRPLASLSDRAKLVVRIEAVKWWELGAARRDFVAAWDDASGALAWVEMDSSSGAAMLRGWLD
jgi:protein ImuB